MTDLKFYRYKTVEYAVKDIDGEFTASLFPNPKLELVEYDLIKETDKGYWVGLYGVKHKWVPKNSKKKFAYLNKEDALTNYIKRTESSIKIMESQLTRAKIGLSLAEELKNRSM